MKKKFLFFILMLVILNTTFSEKITNYVNKKDVEAGNKIFLFKAEPNNKSNNKDNQNKNESNVNNNLKDSDKDYNKVNNLVEINRNSTKNIVQIPENKVSEIDLEYIEAKEIAEKLDGFNGYKLVGIDNKIIINGNGKEMENLKRIIKSLDKPKEQIVIKRNNNRYKFKFI